MEPSQSRPRVKKPNGNGNGSQPCVAAEICEQRFATLERLAVEDARFRMATTESLDRIYRLVRALCRNARMDPDAE